MYTTEERDILNMAVRLKLNATYKLNIFRA